MLPLSFHNTWITNRERQPERVLSNADHLSIPQHNYATFLQDCHYLTSPLSGMLLALKKKTIQLETYITRLFGMAP